MTTFLDEVTTLLDTHAGKDKFAVVASKEYPGTGCAHVDVSLAGVFLRIKKDRNTDFSVEVARPSEPDKFWYLSHLLLLVTHQPIERSRVMVGHGMDDIGRVLETLMANYEQVVSSLAPAKWSETERQLIEVRKQLMHPAIRSALERARK